VEREAVRINVPFDALDLCTATEFVAWVLARVDDDVPPEVDVVLDLDGVEFVMAAGVQALLDLEAALGERGLSLRVARAAPIVARVLDICGVATRWSAS
jgi:anti-anti-sigma factor